MSQENMEQLKSLEGKFEIQPKVGWWRIKCPTCKQVWRLEGSQAIAIGSILKLLNHHASHEEKENDE